MQNLKLLLPFFTSIWLINIVQTRPETRIGFGDTKPIVERVLSSAPLGMDGLWLAALHADDVVPLVLRLVRCHHCGREPKGLEARQLGRDTDAVFAETLQSLSAVVRRCQARALLRRLA